MVVSLQADIYLTSTSNETAWQFGVYNAFGGINILPDRSLQIATPGFPVTGPFHPVPAVGEDLSIAKDT